MQISISRQLGLQPATVGNFFMNARRRLHDKWHELHGDNDASGDGSLINDDETDFVNDLVDDPQQQLDSNDLQACLGHDSVQAMLMDHQVDSCGELIGHHMNHHHHQHHHHHHLENVPKDNSARLQMSVPQLQQQQQQLHHEHQQHVYSLTSL